MTATSADAERVVRTVVAAVRLASRVALSAQRELARVARAVKPDASPVTSADLAAQAVVVRAIEREFPDALVCAEEDGDGFAGLTAEQRADAAARAGAAYPELADQAELARALNRGRHAGWTCPVNGGKPFFVVDPIDGTKGFLRGSHFAVCVGFVDERGRGALGCLGCPRLPASAALVARAGTRVADDDGGSLFVAWIGRGALEMLLFPGTEADARLSAALSASPPSPPPPPAAGTRGGVRSVESYESSHKAPALEDVKRACGVTESVMLDSQTKFGMLARGDADVFPRITRHDQFIWDVLPGAVVATEAGCAVTDAAGAPLSYVRGRTLRTNTVLSARTAALNERMVRAAAQSGVPGSLPD